MRELTKSMMSLSWAMPLYAMKQMLNLSVPQDMTRPFGKATEGFDAVTGAMREQMGPTLKGMFQAGDQIQRGLVDMSFSMLGLQMFDPSSWMKMSSDVMQGSAQGMRDVASATGAAASAAGQAGASAMGGAGARPGTWR